MPDNSIKIAADITFNTKQAEQQFSQLGASLSNTVNTALSSSKSVRDMADAFNKMSTRGMEDGMARVVRRIRTASDGVLDAEHRLKSITNEYERLQNLVSSGALKKGTADWMSASDDYKNTIAKLKEYRDEYAITQEVISRGSKLTGFKSAKEGGAAIYTPLSPDELERERQSLSYLDEKIVSTETHLQDMVARGDVFPQMRDRIDSATVALVNSSSKVLTLIQNFNALAQTASATVNPVSQSFEQLGQKMNALSGINFTQPVQTQTVAVQQGMNGIVNAITEGTQQVQQQVEATKQTIAQPVTTQIIDTTAIQNQLMFLSGQLSLLVTEVTTKMDNVASAITSGFENANNVVNDKVNEINNNVQSLGQQSASIMNNLVDVTSSSMQQASANVRESIASLESAVRRTETSTRGVGTSAKKSSKVAVVAFGSIEGAIRSTFNVAKKLASHVGNKLSSAFNNVQKSVDKAFSGRSLKRGLTTLIKYTFGVRSIYFLFRKLRAAVKEGLQNLVKYEKAVGTSQAVGSVNKAITSLNTSLLYLKNAWAAAFAPIITAVMPMLTTLINGLASVGNYIARFIGALTGQEVVLNAVKVSAGDYAKSLDNTKKSANGASKAAKKLSDRLASFDDLNILGKDNDNDSGSGSGAGDIASDLPNPADMFKYVKAESSLADMLKDAWASGDFSGIGSMIKDKIIEVLNGIDWDEVQQNVTKFAGGVGSFLEGLLGDPNLYITIGSAAGNAFNTINKGIEELLKHTKNIKFGENIGKGINEFLKTSDFVTAGKNVNETITQITDNINDLVNTISSEDVVNAITNFLDGLNIGDIIAKVGECALKVTKLVIEVIGGLVVNWGEDLGEAMWNTATNGKEITLDGVPVVVEPTISAVDFPVQSLIDTILTKVGEIVVTPIVKIGAEFSGKSEVQVIEDLSNAWDKLGETLSKSPVEFFLDKIGLSFESMKETFDDTWGNDFKTGLEAVKLGFEELGEIVVTFMVDFVDWCTKVGDDFKKFGDDWNAFWALFEGFDIEDLLEGIGEGVSTHVIEPLVGLFDKFAEFGGDIVEGLKSGVTDALINISGWLEENVFVPIGEAFCKLFGISSPSTVAEEWGVFIMEGLLNGINSLVEDVSKIFTDIYDNIVGGWEKLKTDAETKWGNIKSTLSTKAGEIKSTTEDTFNNLKDNLSKTWSSISGTAYAKWDNIKKVLVDAVNAIKNALKTPINGIISIIESMVNKVIGGLNSMFSKLNSMPDFKITNPFNGKEYNLSLNLPTIKNVSIPRLAQGAVIPPNREFMAVLGDQSHGTNVEAPLDTIKQAVAEVMGNNGNAEVVQLLQQLIGVVESKNLVIGDKEIAKANARYNNQQRLIRGASF